MINWKVRVRNKMFWLAIVPALLVLLKEVLDLCGISFDPSTLSAQLADIIESVFLVLSLLGIVNDPTTAGLSDSVRAMTYEEPSK